MTGHPFAVFEHDAFDAQLGQKQINIDNSYCGLEPGSTLALMVFGVDNLTTAATLLDEQAVENT